jgi:hypothetical protein
MKVNYWKAGAGLAVVAGTVLLADAWWGEKYFFRTKRFRIGKPDSAKQVRILLLSDLHFKKQFWPFHQKLAERLKALRPDLVLIAGDVIDEHGTPGPANRFLHHLQNLSWFAIPGNHDNKNRVSRQTLRKIVERNGGRLLVNETVRVSVGDVPFTITGLEDFIEGESGFADAVKAIGKEENHLLLVHSPLQQEHVLKEVQRINTARPESRQLALQYIFAGHTHGGQVRLDHHLIPFLPEKSGGYVNGWYNREKPFLYVSKGFGTSAIPFRFGARAEITVLEYGV